MKVFFLLSFLFFGFLCSPLSVEAATVRINPTKVRLIISPGESESGKIEVENPSEQALIVKVYAQDWEYTALYDGTKEFLPLASSARSCAKWINFSLSDLVVPAFGKQIIHYTVKVPVDAVGGYFAVLFFESQLNKPEIKESAQLGVVIRIGSLFFIETKTSATRKAQISNLYLENKEQDKPLVIGFDLKNIGNTDITSAATFHIIDKKGMVFARSEFNTTYTFPEDTAKLKAVWQKPLPSGKYDLVLTVDIGKSLEEAGLGRGPVITKEADLEVGGDGKVIKIGQIR